MLAMMYKTEGTAPMQKSAGSLSTVPKTLKHQKGLQNFTFHTYIKSLLQQPNLLLLELI